LKDRIGCCLAHGFGLAAHPALSIVRYLPLQVRKPKREAGILARRKIEIADTVAQSAETTAHLRARAKSVACALRRRDWATLRPRSEGCARDESRRMRGA